MKLYLVECFSKSGKLVNICVTNNISHAKNVCVMYKDKNATYKSITDVKALNIIQKYFGCQIAIF